MKDDMRDSVMAILPGRAFRPAPTERAFPTSITAFAARTKRALGAFAVAGLGLLLSACSPSKSERPAVSAALPGADAPREGAPSTEGMVRIPGGKFLMGDEGGFSHERPVHEVELSPFFLDVHEVTNRRFAKFVAATGYVTEAENWGWSLGYDPAIPPDEESHEHVPGVEWWVKIDGANWRRPTGPESSIEGGDDLPVLQVSWNDAVAFCEWEGKRLPTEAEWEYAARGGLEGAQYPNGDELAPEGKWTTNIWQGHFPAANSGEDGFEGVAPVGSFAPNGFGLHDMAGNVWEWVHDWYDARYYDASPPRDPRGPDSGAERVLRGGSWMCSDNYCIGYRVSHRNKATPDSGLNNTGFRCALSAEAP